MSVPARLAAASTPCLLLVYAVARWVDGRDGAYGPGGTAWDAGHVVFLAAFLGFGVLALALGRAGGPARRALSGACLVGVGLFCWVILTDLLPRLDEAASLPDPLMLL